MNCMSIEALTKFHAENSVSATFLPFKGEIKIKTTNKKGSGSVNESLLKTALLTPCSIEAVVNGSKFGINVKLNGSMLEMYETKTNGLRRVSGKNFISIPVIEK